MPETSEKTTFRDFLDARFKSVEDLIREVRKDMVRWSERHTSLDLRVTRLEQRVEHHERQNDRAAAMWRWVLGLAIPVLLGAGAYLILQFIETLR